MVIFSLYFYALHKWLVLYCCRGQLAHASRCTAIARTFSEQVIASILVGDSRCGMSDVEFRTGPPIGGLSCFYNYSYSAEYC